MANSPLPRLARCDSVHDPELDGLLGPEGALLGAGLRDAFERLARVFREARVDRVRQARDLALLNLNVRGRALRGAGEAHELEPGMRHRGALATRAGRDEEESRACDLAERVGRHV